MYPDGTYEDFALTDFEPGGIEDNGKGNVIGNMLYEVLEEKYTSLIGQIEVFNDMSRTDNYLGLAPTTGGQLPERFLIPQAEIDGNTNAPSPIPDLFEPTWANSGNY